MPSEEEFCKIAKQELSYDAWGRLRNPSTQEAYTSGSEPSLFIGRGYTGHEHLPWFGLVNMNARLYDPLLGRFLSPDPYVQAPDFTQNFNRYSYCLNNPLVYVDEDGEFWHLIVGAVVGGVGNLVANWKNIEGFWQGFSTFLTGAGAVVAVAATGGAGAGFWAVAGVSAGGGALVGANNDIVSQTGKDFAGFNKVNWGQVGTSSAIGGVAGFAGGGTGYWAANSSILVNNINSPLLRSAVTSPLASGAGHVAGGTTAGLLEGQGLGKSFDNSLNGLGSSMIVGGAIGVASTVAVSYANGINPLTGKPLNNSTSPNVQHTLSTLEELKADGATITTNKMTSNQELNLTIEYNGQKLDMRIETHPLPAKYGGDGIIPIRHLNLDLYPRSLRNLPNNGHIILPKK